MKREAHGVGRGWLAGRALQADYRSSRLLNK